MAIERKNNLGTIKLDDYIFAQIIRTSLLKSEGKAFHASERGKLLGNQGVKSGIGEIASNIKISDDGEAYRIEFYVIILFGAGIRRTTKEILDYIEYEMKGLFPEKGGRLILKIVGIKSKRIAPRSIRVVREYEPAR